MYDVKKDRFSKNVISSHETLAAAGAAALEYNRAHPHYTEIVGVYSDKHGDVTGPAFAAAKNPPRARGPRRLESRKHPKGADEIDRLLASLRAPSKRSAGRR